MTDINIHISENDLDAQVTQVGMEFTVGIETDAEIDRLLGFETQVAGDKLNRLFEDALTSAPRYCADAALCLDLLEKRGIYPMILPTMSDRPKKSFVSGYVGIFDVEGVLYATTAQLTEEAAAACMLWFVLAK